MDGNAGDSGDRRPGRSSPGSLDALSVRLLRLEEVDVRIAYFHGATDAYLHTLGVDRARLPGADPWRRWYAQDYARPIEQRQNVALAWERAGTLIGFSSVDRILYGIEAFMHLHIIVPGHRGSGLGAQFVRMSARTFFDLLSLERLLSEPHAFNVAPNRTLQRAGFRYLRTHETVPGDLNFEQVVNTWVLSRAMVDDD